MCALSAGLLLAYSTSAICPAAYLNHFFRVISCPFWLTMQLTCSQRVLNLAGVKLEDR